MADLSEQEIEELVELETLCYPPEQAYSLEFMSYLLSLDGAHLIRRREGPCLAGFQLSHLGMGELITLDVHPDFRRRGIGSDLLREALDVMRKAGQTRVFCTIAVDNEPSLSLHGKFGFEIDDEIPHYYAPGHHAYLMSVILPDSPGD